MPKTIEAIDPMGEPNTAPIIRPHRALLFFLTTFTTIVLFGIILQLRCARAKDKSNWEIYRWHSVYWKERTDKNIIFDLYLYAPPSLDVQAKIVFLRNALKTAVRSQCEGANYNITYKDHSLRTETERCFSHHNLVSRLLDINMHDINLQSNRTVISFDIKCHGVSTNSRSVLTSE